MSPDDRLADEAAARRAEQIVSGLLQGRQPGAPQPGKPQFPQQQGQGGGRRRRRRGGRGRNRDAHGPFPPRQPQPGYSPTASTPKSPHELNQPAIPRAAVPRAESAPQQQPPVVPPATEGAPSAVPEAAVSEAASAPMQQPEPSYSRQRATGQWREATYQSSSVTPQQAPANVRKVVLMNASEPGEVRVAILENGELAEIFMERKSQGQQAGNVYKGRVVNVEPSLQAAFVDLGTEKNGFLHASDCIPPDGGYADILPKSQKGGRGQEQQRPQQTPATPAQAAPASTESVVGGESAAPPVGEEAGATAAPEGPAQPAAGMPPGSAVPGGHGKRRRRRRGGRGRSGRGRPPAPAPMVAPTPDSESAPLDNGEPLEKASAQPEEDIAENGDAAAMPAEMDAIPAGTETDSAIDASVPEAVQVVSEERPEEAVAPVTESEVAPAEDAGRMEAGAPASPAEGAEGVPILAPGQPVPAALTPQQQRGGRGGRERPHDRRYSIQEMLREGQEVLVQVAKEGIGQKGPALTTYLSMPGRYLVLMPAVPRLGVSKRIENEEQRRTLKDVLNAINPPEDMGVIVRTAGTGRAKEELQRDLNYLMCLWDNLKKKAKMAKAPALIYQEGDVVTRVFRDVITDDVAEIILDDPVVLERAREFLRETAPGTEQRLKLYTEREPLFHRYGVEQQIQRLFNRKVNLKSGGSIVIEQTEALVAIDVNTGRFREKRNQDDTILQTNLEAAREIARQLRLRDIGGLVMIDFIDMDIHEHRRRVERELKAHLARDKARINVLPVSALGVVEMTRQRVRLSLRKTLFERCPHCSGSGQIKSGETLGLEMLREIKCVLKDAAVRRIKVLLNSAAAFAILNLFRRELVRLEERFGVSIEVCGDAAVALSQMQVSTAREAGEWVLKKVSDVDDYVRNT